AFMSMFQILTQKGWVAVMHDTMDSVQRSNLGRGPVVLTAIYFVIYHLFVTLIILSLFVAVILDNLELDEDIKKLKQRKMREIISRDAAEAANALANIRKMIKLGRLLSDFLLPRIRDSFMRQFAGADSAADELQYCEAMESLSPELKRKVRGLKGEEKRFAINFIVDESNRMRLEANCLDQVGIGGGGGIGQVSLLGAQHHLRQERRSTTVRNRHGPSAVGGGGGGGGGGGIVAGQTVANKVQPDKAVHFRENGEVVHMTSARRNDDYDIKMLQQKAQQAERLRSQQEADLRENHPFFDKPLFAVGRESQFRDFCQLLVDARYRGSGESELKSRGKGASKMLGMITYLDWTMITLSVFSITSAAVAGSSSTAAASVVGKTIAGATLSVDHVHGVNAINDHFHPHHHQHQQQKHQHDQRSPRSSPTCLSQTGGLDSTGQNAVGALNDPTSVAMGTKRRRSLKATRSGGSGGGAALTTSQSCRKVPTIMIKTALSARHRHLASKKRSITHFVHSGCQDVKAWWKMQVLRSEESDDDFSDD
uniref:Ion_trans domain-containing protein n=1 Tax=Macrostomum lignano TaxID=282301 RepID=A0A1I8IWV7_9PLAT